MAIRIYHPEHGYHHVYDSKELDTHIALGWSEDAQRPSAPQLEALPDEDAIRKAYFDKFGKKPHHMAKLETIKKALDDNS